MSDIFFPEPLDQNDRRLLDNVHPEAWVNPKPASCYNLVVIGAGTAGLVTAAGAAGLGAKVALVERSLLGGDCLNTGCVPSKALIRSSRAVFDMRSAAEFGVRTEELTVDFSAAMERMRRLRADISRHDSVARFSRELNVDVFLGQARFTGKDSIDVGGVTLRFRKAAICTGSRPAVPPIPGLAESGYLTNETIFQLTRQPKRLAVIGGGPIGCELAQVFARMGSSVTLLERGERLLPRDDAEAGGTVCASLERDGVRILFRKEVLSVAQHGKEKRITITGENGKTELAVDALLVAAGRVPNIDSLDLDRAGVTGNAGHGVAVNDHLQTTNPALYAAGDVCSSYRFTHAADAMARIVIANALFGGRQKFSDLVIPWCTYTDPEVAQVGMVPGKAGSSGFGVQTLTVQLSGVDRAVLDGRTEGFARVHLKKGTDRILGATIVARDAGEMISELTLAITSRRGLSSIGKTIHPYPTQSEVVKKLADQYNKTRLTPLIKRLLSAWFAWRRT